MWSKWPVLAVMLVACSGEGDELQAPMLGDCPNCGTAPVSGGGISGGGTDASFGDADAGDASFDASTDGLDLVDVGVNPDAGNAPDGTDIVDVGVPSDLDAPLNP